MNKENRNDKLSAFLRTHKPDVPRARAGFEEQLLDATVRRHWRVRFSKLLRTKQTYAWASTCVATALAITLLQPNRNSDQVDSFTTNATQTPAMAIVQTQQAEISEEDALLFLADSLTTLSSGTDHDLISTLDAL